MVIEIVAKWKKKQKNLYKTGFFFKNLSNIADL